MVFTLCSLSVQDVKFPLKLDMFEFCSPELQQKLTPVRQKFKEVEDKLIAEADRKKTASILGSEEGSENKESNEPITMEVDEAKIEYEPYSFDDGETNKYVLLAHYIPYLSKYKLQGLK